MKTGTKHAAQLRADRIHEFREELRALAAEDVLHLTTEQTERLEQYHKALLDDLSGQYDIDTSNSQKRISWGMRAASLLGGLAFCAAFVLFFHRIWGLLPFPLQVGLPILIPLLLIAATELAARREITPYYTSLIGLVTLASFMLGLSVLGSIFNLPPSPGVMLAWGGFAILIAYRYRFLLQLTAGLVLLITWGAAVVLSAAGGPGLAFIMRPEGFFPGVLVALILPSLLPHRSLSEFPAIYRLVGSAIGLLAVLILCFTGENSFLPGQDRTLEAFYQFAGLALSATAVWLGIRFNQLAVVNLGSAFFTAYLFIRLYNWWWELMPKFLFFLLLGLIAVGLLILFRRLRGRMPVEVQS